MKILMLVPFLPNTSTSGGQTRWYNIIKYMSDRHEITLFSLIKDESERRFIPELEKYCKKVMVFTRPKSPWSIKNILAAEFGWFPLLVVRNRSLAEKRAVEAELHNEHYDLIHAETFYVMPHIPKTDIPTILVEQTIEYMVYQHHVDTQVPFVLKPFYLLDVAKLKFWETYYWRKTNRLVAVSDEDRRIMREIIPSIKVDIIPNGLDSEFFAQKKVKKMNPPRILYGVAGFKWLQNVEAVDILISHVWPIIKSKLPNVILWIVGRNIPERIKAMAIKSKRIEVTESIADQRDAYKGSTVMVAPIKGSGGTRLKVLEAMGAGTPVVSTSIGVAGLGIKDSENAFIEDTYEGMANRVIEIVTNPAVGNRVGENGRKFVKKHYDWRAVVKLHDKIYSEMVAK